MPVTGVTESKLVDMYTKAASAVCLILLSAPLATAQQGTFSGGITLTSNYISNGETQTRDNPAIQPWLEYQIGAFYIGTWWSNVSFDGNDDNIEFDVYVGARGLLDHGFYYDAGYARYLYDDTGDCCGEVLLTLGYDHKETVAVEAYTAYDPDADAFNSRLSFSANLAPRFDVSGTYGWREVNDNEYYDVGVAYALTPNMRFDLRYHGAETGFDGIVASFDVFSSDSNLGRMFQKPFQR